ncbi:pyruvate kinase [Tanacetum coccineum]
MGSARSLKADMVKAQCQVVDILCNIKLIYPPAFFDIMIHLVIHLPQEALEGEPILSWWMYPFERYMKKLKNYDVMTKFNHPDRNVDCPPPTCQFQIRQRYIDKDPGVSASGELFALACGPTSSLVSVNSCVVNGVRFVVHIRDERCTTQNSGICSPGEKDGDMYYEDDHDVIHFDNSSDLALSTSLNDLDFATLNIDGQSMDVDAPPDITDVDEDDDFIDDEDVLPRDLADFNDEVLANDDDNDDVAVVYSSEEED